MLQTIRRLLIRPGCFRLERELPGGVCTHDICAPWQGTQWNKIEHRLFSFITQNWRGKPLISYLVIVQLIASTTTDTGQMELYFRPEVARRMMRLSGLRPLGAFSDPLNSRCMTDFSRIGAACESPREIDPGGPCASRLFVGPA